MTYLKCPIPCHVGTVRMIRIESQYRPLNQTNSQVTHEYRTRMYEVPRKAAWFYIFLVQLLQYKKSGSCYTEFRVQRTLSQIRNPAWVSVSVSH